MLVLSETLDVFYPSTTSRTFEMAAHLRSFDFDFAGLSRQMDSMSSKIAKLQGYVYDHLEIDENGASRVTLTQELLKHYKSQMPRLLRLSLHLVESKTSASGPSLSSKLDGHYRVRMRSKALVINEIAKRHDGGGHPLASGANSYSLEENEQIYRELQEVAKAK